LDGEEYFGGPLAMDSQGRSLHLLPVLGARPVTYLNTSYFLLFMWFRMRIDQSGEDPNFVNMS